MAVGLNEQVSPRLNSFGAAKPEFVKRVRAVRFFLQVRRALVMLGGFIFAHQNDGSYGQLLEGDVSKALIEAEAVLQCFE